MHKSRKIRTDEPDLELCTDASELGWGAHTDTWQTGLSHWLKSEDNHLNVLNAILFGLKSLCKQPNLHIPVRTDNTTVLAYVTNMGGTRYGERLAVAREIWSWAQSKHTWITITHILGVENVLADLRSTQFKDLLKWSLNPHILQDICKHFGTPDVDLFASWLNNKLPRFVSLEPNPDIWKMDLFSFPWNDMFVFHCSGYCLG